MDTGLRRYDPVGGNKSGAHKGGEIPHLPPLLRAGGTEVPLFADYRLRTNVPPRRLSRAAKNMRVQDDPGRSGG